jgi:hypothetical protein
MGQSGWRRLPRRNVTDLRRSLPAIDAHTANLKNFQHTLSTTLRLRDTMRPTAACLAPGFMKRSLDEFKRLSLFGKLRIASSLCLKQED